MARRNQGRSTALYGAAGGVLIALAAWLYHRYLRREIVRLVAERVELESVALEARLFVAANRTEGGLFDD